MALAGRAKERSDGHDKLPLRVAVPMRRMRKSGRARKSGTAQKKSRQQEEPHRTLGMSECRTGRARWTPPWFAQKRSRCA